MTNNEKSIQDAIDLTRVVHGTPTIEEEWNFKGIFLEIPGKGTGWEREQQSGTYKLVRHSPDKTHFESIPFPSRESREGFLRSEGAIEHEIWI